ncbi:MAG TPA: septum formation initiator family protein [Chitinophagaceae bacterium]|nr:septum formation initiator family protein [Chitinophagaceae bacterium]
MKKIFSLLFNKYLLTSAAFVVWMTFFDQNDWMTQKDTRKQLQDVKDNIQFLTAKTEGMERELHLLKSDPETLERYAREHYRMKRDNEDLYVIERK